MNQPKYRVLWTWDFATCWDHSYFGRERGCSGKSSRREAFLEDYKRLVDYSAAHHFNGVVIWGAVRSHHNGENQLKELVKYGREKGVRILPGVSTFGYGGVCYDPRKKFNGVIDLAYPDHPYSLQSWLRKHPEYAAIDKNGKPYEYGPLNVIACPSRKENIEWFAEALSWLYEEFDVDGIQSEVGDYGVCYCPLCTARRGKAEKEESFSVDDMLNAYNTSIAVSKKHKKDAWVICETYSSLGTDDGLPGTQPSMKQIHREELTKLPDDAILQWMMDRTVGFATQKMPAGTFVPKKNNILRIHAGCQWSQNNPADWGVTPIFDLCRIAKNHNINGVSIFGEESPFNPPNEANYLAFEEACGFGNENPNLDEEIFYSKTLDPLYGGNGLAKHFREIYIEASMLKLGQKLEVRYNSRQPLENLTRNKDFRKIALNMSHDDKLAALTKYYEEARSISHTLSGEVCGRWSWLENAIWQMRYVEDTKIL